jgi:hypothetical protein
MTVTPLEKTGNSSKFLITLTKGRGEFMISLSYSLCHKIWQITDEDAKRDAATQMAAAIVGRHDPKLPFKEKYIFSNHNTPATLSETILHLHKVAV